MTQNRLDCAVPDRVREQLSAREPIFHHPEFGTDARDYLGMTADDYWEVGASGRVYERDLVVQTLVERGKVAGDENWIVSDVKLSRLATNAEFDVVDRPLALP